MGRETRFKLLLQIELYVTGELTTVHAACPCSPKMSRKCGAGPSQPRHLQSWWRDRPWGSHALPEVINPTVEAVTNKSVLAFARRSTPYNSRRVTVLATAQLTFVPLPDFPGHTTQPVAQPDGGWHRDAKVCRSAVVGSTPQVICPSKPAPCSFPHRTRGPEEESGDTQNGGENGRSSQLTPPSSTQLWVFVPDGPHTVGHLGSTPVLRLRLRYLHTQTATSEAPYHAYAIEDIQHTAATFPDRQLYTQPAAPLQLGFATCAVRRLFHSRITRSHSGNYTSPAMCFKCLISI